jgi:hypothetical protein
VTKRTLRHSWRSFPGRVALLVRPSEDNGIIKSGRLLEGHIRAKGVTKARDEHLDLLRLREGHVAAQESDEMFGQLIDSARVAQHG